jgi:hypothetical protein
VRAYRCKCGSVTWGSEDERITCEGCGAVEEETEDEMLERLFSGAA